MQYLTMRGSLVFLGLCGLVTVFGQTPFLGRCPNRPVVQQFRLKEYLGRWYEIEKSFAVFELGGVCIQAFYSPQSNNTIGVMNSQIQKRDGKLKTVHGTARALYEDGSARLAVKFDTTPFGGEGPYYVLATDYTQYSIVWSCTDLGLFNFQFLWFLAREKNPSSEVRNLVHQRMDEMGIRRDLLTATNQTNCDG